jgi:hypothetical protein
MASAARRAAVARPPFRSLVWWGGLMVLAVGLVLALEGVWAAVAPALLSGAVLMWFAGAWVLPWSRDGYLRRLMRLWNAWATHAQWAYSQFSQRQAKFGDRLAALAPPRDLSVEHERLVSLAGETDRLRRDSAIPFAERVHQVTLTRQAARQVKDEAVRRAVTGTSRRYADALDRLSEERRRDYAAAAARSERATEQAAERLARIRPPRAAKTDHDALVAAFGALLAAAREFHAAAQAADPDRASLAAAGWESAMADVREARGRIIERLELDERWPSHARLLE